MGTRALAVLLLLAPSLARAQVSGQTTLSVYPRVDFDTTQINRSECNSTTANVAVKYLPAMVTGQTFVAGSDRYRFFTGTSACSSTLPSSGSFASNITANDITNVQTLNVAADALRAQLSFTCTQASDTTYYVCVYLTDSALTTVKGTAFSGALTFQMAMPPAPVITGHVPGNGAIEVTVTPGTATATETAISGITYQAVASATGQTTQVAPVPPNGGTTIRVGNLVNGVTYQVVAYAYSSAGNTSAASAPVSDTPLPFEDFWTAYKNAGGREQGGCGGGAGALSLLALLPLALRRRR